MSRLVATQREQIAVLKAFGHRATTVAAHYLAMALVPVLVGAALGLGVGLGLLARIYVRFFQFPEGAAAFHPDPVMCSRDSWCGENSTVSISFRCSSLGSDHEKPPSSSVFSARRGRPRGVSSAEAVELAATAARAATDGHRAAEQRRGVARFEVEAARSALLDAERGTTIELLSPAAGEVLRLFEHSERVLAAGEPVLEVGDRRQMEILIEVLTTDAVVIRPGLPLRIDVGGGEGRAPRRASVERIEPAAFTKVSPLGVEEQRVLVVGRLTQENLTLGVRVRAEVVLWSGADVLQVPMGALFRTEKGWAVYRLDGDRARRVEVRVGQRGPRAAEVLAGLAPGDQVVLYPSDKVDDGVRVALNGGGR